MATSKLFFAGSGGQGIILMGQMLTYAAMYDEQEVTFMPSYGPEMRGGTANCTVVVSDKPICSPLIYEADAVIAMNLPSMTRFESLVKPGGMLFVNTSLIEEKPTRTDIEIVNVAAGDIARELGVPRALNMVMLGAVIRKTGIVTMESVDKIMQKTFSGRKEKLLAPNREAILAWKG